MEVDRSTQIGVMSLTIIVTSAVGAMVFSAVLAIALARTAARADADAERVLRRRDAPFTIAAYRKSYTYRKSYKPTP